METVTETQAEDIHVDWPEEENPDTAEMHLNPPPPQHEEQEETIVEKEID